MKKRMLFIGMNFHTYEPQIVQEYQKQGYDVEKIEDHPSDFLGYGLLPFNIRVHHILRFQQSLIKKIVDKKYDVVLVIVGRFLQPFFLDELRKNNPTAKFILYLWDDVKRVENFFDVRDFYDEIVSFDPFDCAKYGFRFLPLYYMPDYADVSKGEDKFEYDICTTFCEHSDRMKVINALIEKYGVTLKQYYHILSSGASRYFPYILSGKRKDDLKAGIYYTRKQLSINEVARLMKRSRAIIDVQHISQKGLTNRTLETVGAKRKLLTTNEQVKYYDFYDPENIYIIDRNNPEIDIEVIRTPYKEIDEKIYEKYSLQHWTKSLIAGSDETYLTCDISDVINFL